MRVIRVFPQRTSFTPVDDMAFVGEPPLMRPEADVVHVSCVFTWDMGRAERLARAWGQYYPVEIGGPAFGSLVSEFIPGLYVRYDVTITSRGCPSRCAFCLVPGREGDLTEYPVFSPGYIIQDNNLLACSREHQERVYEMLRKQPRAVVFSGGLAAYLVNDWVVEQFKTLRIAQAFFACDTEANLPALRRARGLLPFLSRDKLRCYVLLGFNGESLADGVERLHAVWDAGYLPFAQLYQPPNKRIDYPEIWRHTARSWTRPAATKAMMQGSIRRWSECEISKLV